MINALLKYYLKDDELSMGFMPLDVAILDPDFYLYFFARRDNKAWYVVAENSYFFLDEVVSDIEATFAVSVDGWLQLLDKRGDDKTHLLSPNIFTSKNANDMTDSEWENMHKVMLANGRKFVVLKVTPKEHSDSPTPNDH